MSLDPERRRPFWYLRRRSSAVRREVEEELRFHIEMRIAEFRARGLTEDAARRAAYEQFGNVDGTRRYCVDQDQSKERHMVRQLAFQDLAQDVRISCRSLLRVPVLTATILATVG